MTVHSITFNCFCKKQFLICWQTFEKLSQSRGKREFCVWLYLFTLHNVETICSLNRSL